MQYAELESGTKEILLLVPELAMDRIKETYVKPLHNVPKSTILVGKLYLEEKKLASSVRKQFINDEIVPVVQQEQIKLILVTDGEYFKTLTKKTKADIYLGYVLKCAYCDCNVMYLPNFFRIFYQPDIQDKIDFVLKSLDSIYDGTYQEPGKDIIHSARYVTNLKEFGEAFTQLKLNAILTADIETYSLKHNDAGIASIAFAWNEHEGVAFKIDDGKDKPNEAKRKHLRNFFETFTGKLIWHNISFDAYILIYQLWMKDQLDYDGLLEGMKHILKWWDDTKLIAYLALNSCTKGISYGLKDLAQSFAGNYAIEEIDDASQIPTEKLLQYNLVDTLSTWYVYKTYHPKMVADKQLDIYRKIFKPAIKDIIQMQLTGLPINLDRVAEVKYLLLQDKAQALKKINSSSLVQAYTDYLRQKFVNDRNAKLKTKQITIADAMHIQFNPGSHSQIAELLYGLCHLVPPKYTDKNQPSTDSEALLELFNKTDQEDIKTLLDGLLELNQVDKILQAFIPAFEKAIPAPDGWHYLCGNFNLGGTVSGRLSSNNPNLQNLPATGTKYAKLIKSCFQAPPGKLFVGLDFASLEDRISALTTRDQNKLKVYTDHYDGHCLRAFSYFGHQMPDIETANSDEQCFKAVIQGEVVYWKASDEIIYQNKKYRGDVFYDMVAN